MVLLSPALGEDAAFELGGDWYGTGQVVSNASPVTGDVFITGYDATVSARVEGDAHLAGYNARVDAPVSGNVYAGGFAVSIDANVGKDVSALGNSVTIGDVVAGNVRAAGAVVTLSGPVRGSVLAAGGTIVLAGEIGGDADLSGGSFEFEDGAVVTGHLTIHSPDPVDVPASVASADRVTIEIVEPSEQVWDQTNVGMKVMTSPWVLFFGGMVWVAILLVIGLILIALMPSRPERVRTVAAVKPWYSLLAGALSLAILLGLVPVLAMTLVGIPLIPVLFLAMAFFWLFTYLAAGFILGDRIMTAFGRQPISMLAKMVTLAIGLALIWIVGLIPFIGWLAVEALMFLALGAIVLSFTLRWFDPALNDRLSLIPEALPENPV
jgi:hypothetical protein